MYRDCIPFLRDRFSNLYLENDTKNNERVLTDELAVLTSDKGGFEKCQGIYLQVRG